MMTNTVYPSKVDAWLVAILIGGIGFAVVQCMMLRDIAPVGSRIALGLFAFIVMLALIFSLPCRYMLEPDHLLIQSGLIRRQVPYQDITGIELSSDSRSAPALSLRRVKVSCGKSFQLVSPRDREGFMRALKVRVSQHRPGAFA